MDTVFELLDRAYCNNEWKLSFPDASIWNYKMLISDQSPILLNINPHQLHQRRPYKLDSWCLDFMEIDNLTLGNINIKALRCSNSKESSKTQSGSVKSGALTSEKITTLLEKISKTNSSLCIQKLRIWSMHPELFIRAESVKHKLKFNSSTGSRELG